jgi:hypothetical protein
MRWSASARRRSTRWPSGPSSSCGQPFEPRLAESRRVAA